MANNVARIHVRFNLDDEIHKKVYNYLERLDENSTKSKNQFIIDVLDASFDKLYDERNPEQLITRRELAIFKKEIETMVKDEIIRSLGTFISGTRTAFQAQTEHKEEPEVSNDVADTINSWF